MTGFTENLAARKSSLQMGPTPLLATYGDSRSIPKTGDSNGTSNDAYLWLMALSKGRVLVPSSCRLGESGQTSVYLADPARLAAAIAAYKAAGVSIVTLIASTNDRATANNLTYVQTIAALTTMETAFVSAGFIVIWQNEYPKGTETAKGPALSNTPNSQLSNHFAVRRWLSSRRGRPQVMVVDTFGALSANSISDDPSLGYAIDKTLGDGTHLGTWGAIIVARLLLDAIRYLLPPSLLFLPAFQQDHYFATAGTGAANQNPGMFGAGGSATVGSGTIATFWKSGTALSSGLAAVYSKVNVNGRDTQQVVYSGTAPGAVVMASFTGTTMTIVTVLQGAPAIGQTVRGGSLTGLPTIVSGTGPYTLSTSQPTLTNVRVVLDPGSTVGLLDCLIRDEPYGTRDIAAGKSYQLLAGYEVLAGSTGIYSIDPFMFDGATTRTMMSAAIGNPSSYESYPADALDALMLSDPFTLAGSGNLRVGIRVGFYPGAAVSLTLRVSALGAMPVI